VSSRSGDLDLTPLQIDWLLELKPGDTQLIFRGLHSVLEIGSNGHISVYHASFLDFVRDPRRSSNFNIGLENRMNVARAVLKALSSDSHWLDVDDSWLVCFTLHLNVNSLIICFVGASQ
jgi:hypothetical protein